jgi:hypothetical protein
MADKVEVVLRQQVADPCEQQIWTVESQYLIESTNSLVIEMVRGSASSGGTFRREVEVDGDSTGSREVGYVARFTTDRVADRCIIHDP